VKPRRHVFGEEVGRAIQRPPRCGEPADAEGVSGQADQRVGSRLEVGSGKRRRPAVPGAGPLVPPELAQE
jgi:hypothetical protein